MFDFTITEATKAGNIFCSLLFLVTIGIYWKRCTHYPQPICPSRASLLFFLITLFAVTAWFQGDFFGYMSNVKSYYEGIQVFHLEEVYQYIIDITDQNYILFRIIVWGGALSCFVLAARNYKLDTTLSLFWMFLLFASVYSYARASLAMAVYFFGLSVFSKSSSNHKTIKMLLGMAIILTSYVFHKSMAVMILLTFFYFIPINKKTIWPIIIVIIAFGLFIDQYIDSFMQSLLYAGDDQLAEKVENAMEYSKERNKIVASLFGLILMVWGYLPFYLTFIMISIHFLGNGGKNACPQMVKLFRVTFAIVTLSTAIMVFSTKSLTLFYRYLYMSFIPLSFLFVYMLSNGCFKQSIYKAVLYVCGGYNIYFFLMQML